MNKDLKTFLIIAASIIGLSCTIYTVVSTINDAIEVKPEQCYTSKDETTYIEISSRDDYSNMWWVNSCSPYSCERKYVGENVDSDLFYKKIGCGKFQERDRLMYKIKYIETRLNRLESK